MPRTVVTVELQAYDPALPGVRTLYLSDIGYTTAPSDTPASQTFAPLLDDPLSVARRVQGLRGGALKPSVGQIVVKNADGRLDAWAGYAFDGRTLTAKVGPQDGDYTSDFDVVFTGTMDRVDVTEREIVIRLRDAMAAFDTPLLTELYDGDNVPPDGLEGEADLAGAPKPRVYGVVKNIPLVQVNAQKLIYQLSDNAAAGVVPSLYDNGLPLGKYTPTDWAFAATGLGGAAVVAGDTLVIFGGSGVAGAVWTSTDGTTYSSPVFPVLTTSFQIPSIAYSASLDRLVAVADNGEIAYSDDTGATWTAATPAAAATFYRVRRCERRGLFIAVGLNGVIHTSPTGVTWTARTSGTTETLFDIATEGPLLLAVGINGTVITSPTGVTWTVGDVLSGDFYGAIYAADTYVITGPINSVYQSPDALNFTQRTFNSLATDHRAHAFAEANGVLLLLATETVVSPAPPDQFCVSYDRGTTWTHVGRAVSNSANTTSQLIPFNDRWYSINPNGFDRSGSPQTFASLADLEDDTLAPAPGTFKYIAHSTGTYVRLGAQPAGQLTADVTQGTTAADRTAAALIEAVLTDAGYTSADWVAADFTALDTADGSAIHGLYVSGTTTVTACLDALASSVGAYWTLDNTGTFRVKQLAAPSGSSTFSITDANLIALQRLAVDDPLLGIPTYRTTLRYGRNYVVQRDGLAGAVSAARRADLGREWREAVDTDTAVQTVHLLARATVDDTTYVEASDALAEAVRRQALRGTMRQAYRATVPLDDFATIDVGAVGTLTSSRFGLSGGELVRVLGVEPNGRARTVTFTLWL